MKYIIIYSLFLFIFSCSELKIKTRVPASEKDQNCYVHILNIFDAKKNITQDEEKYLAYYNSAISKVNSELLDGNIDIERPPGIINLEITLKDSEGALYYLEGDVKIETPFQYELQSYSSKKLKKMKSYTKHPKYSIPLFYHEYGHSIFIHNIKKNKYINDNVISLSLREESLSLRGKQLFEELDQLELSITNENSSLVKKKHHQIKGIISELELIKKNKKDPLFIKNDSIISSFEELFSDIIAVLTINDPKAIVNTLKFTKNEITEDGLIRENDNLMSSLYDDRIYRDFTHKNNSIERWIESEDIHEAMAPTRYFLYINYLKRPRYQNPKHKKTLLKNVFVAISEVAEELMRDEKNYSKTVWNELLISRIKELMPN